MQIALSMVDHLPRVEIALINKNETSWMQIFWEETMKSKRDHMIYPRYELNQTICFDVDNSTLECVKMNIIDEYIDIII
jgi:hypothetical protein